MAQMYLSLIFHNHQPVGNFDFIFKSAFENAYKPLTDCLDRHPTIKVAIHFTGPLLDWLQIHQRDYLGQVAAQVKRGQVEILSGGYYEPILSMLLDEDKLGQIQKSNTVIEQLFGVQPKGMWLAERIWEPYFPKPLHQSGIDYTIVDDHHFMATGFTPEELFGYFVTEEQGYPLKLVPSQQYLRRMIPWHPVHEIMNWLQEQATTRNLPGKSPVWAVMGDDGEKFGYWQQSRQVWREKWLDNFFTALEENNDWIQTIQPQHYLDKHRPLGRAYLPTSAYEEMGEWALPAKASWILHDLREQYKLQLEHIPDWDRNKTKEIENSLRFLQGGFWRNFLVKYPEINHMQKRSQALSKKIHAQPDSEARQQALEAIWASQCNCAYWHGIFGGVYMFHIRQANYANIMRAEMLIEPDDLLYVEQHDFNGDTEQEIIASNGLLKIIIEPAQGGMITELDYRPALYNLLNIMTRYPEGYHTQIREAAATNMIRTPADDINRFEGEPVLAKERGLENYIFQDWHRRGMFIEHFPGTQTTLRGFEAGQYPEQGDFVDQYYQTRIEETADKIVIHLTRNGHVWVGNIHAPILIEKILHLQKNTTSLHIDYRVNNQSGTHIKTRFGIETSYGFDGGDNREYCHVEIGDQSYDLRNARETGNITTYYTVSKLRQLGVRVTLDTPATLWYFPLAPITLSDEGFERVHQGAVFFQWWNLDLAAGESKSLQLQLDIATLSQ